MTLRQAIEVALGFILFALTIEILVRRWLYGQIPTQLSAGWVYALIAINLMALVYIFKARRLRS